MTGEPAPPFPWLPGEHVAVIGDTGTGKSYLLAKGLLRMRNYVVVLKTKADDDDADKWQGFHRIRKARGIDNERYSRFLLDPEYRYQAVEGADLLERVWRQGGWTVVIDEGWYAERIGLSEYIDRLLTQGRSSKVSVVFGQQRPVTTSRFVISQSTHVFCFRVEGRDMKTIAEATTPRIVPVIESLQRIPHTNTATEFAYYHRGYRYVGKGQTGTLGRIIGTRGDVEKSSQKAIDRDAVVA